MTATTKGMVIFDLDGTLTLPALDFDAIRAEIGLPPGPILESLGRLSEEARTRAELVLYRHERDAAHRSQLRPGARQTVATLRERGWPVAVLTRNARQWTELVLAKHEIEVDALRSRDDGVIKPSPLPILWLCDAAGCDPQASWMVGDHLFDLQSGRSAGCTTVLIAGSQPPSAWASQADHVIGSLWEVVALVE